MNCVPQHPPISIRTFSHRLASARSGPHRLSSSHHVSTPSKDHSVKHFRMSVLIATVAALSSSLAAAAGDAVASLHCRATGGNAVIGVRPGGTFTTVIALESSLPIIYNSALFRVVLTRPGIAVNAYQWADPFETGGPFDFSLPGMQLPQAVDADTLAGPTYPEGVLDVEFASFLPVGDRGTGTVVEVDFTIPANLAPGETVFITAVPDTFAFGVLTIPTAAGTVLTVRTTFSPDFDGDGVIAAPDLSIYLARWGTPNGDLDGDGLSNSQDLALLLTAWGSSV